MLLNYGVGDLESSLDCKEIKPKGNQILKEINPRRSNCKEIKPKGNQILKEINPRYSLKGLMLKLRLQ